MSMSNTEKKVKDIRRNTRRKFSTEEKIRIVLEGLRGESDVVQHFFTTQLSGFLPFNHIRLILIRAHIAQI